jgi:hypothetical protein
MSIRTMEQDLRRALRRSQSPERDQELIDRHERRVDQAIRNYERRAGLKNLPQMPEAAGAGQRGTRQPH